MTGQQLGSFFTNMADTQAVDDPIQVVLLGFFDGRQEIVGGFLSQALQSGYRLKVHSVEVVGIGYNICPHQLLQHRRTQTVHVHSIL